MYSPILSLTSALDGGGWSTQRPDLSTPGEENRYPLYRTLGGPQGRSGQVRKISGFDLWTAQTIGRNRTDCAIPVTTHTFNGYMR